MFKAFGIVNSSERNIHVKNKDNALKWIQSVLK